MLKILSLLLLIFTISIIDHTKGVASDIIKYEDRNGNLSYSNIETNRDGLKKLEIIEKVSAPTTHQSANINYQLENLFNDKNTGTKLLSNLEINRNEFEQLLYNYEEQLEETQFELNANTVTLDRCYINPVYDYLILFCSGLEYKQQRLLNELDLISNSIENIRSRILALDIQINKLNTQNKSVVCKVNEILSGDSFVCAFGNGFKTVKLIGIETPDSSAKFLELLILGKKVLIKFDEIKTGVNNSLLAYAFIDDTTMLNAMLLRQGKAFALSNYEYKYIYEFNEYEKFAKESKTGIWATHD